MIEMSLKESLRRNERPIIILIVLVLSIFPFFKPLNLPLPTYEYTTRAYRKVDELKPGDLVLVSYDFDPGSWVEIGNALNAVLQHLFQKDVRIVLVSFVQSGPPLEEKAIREINIGDAKYGEDYVILGFIPGFETGMAAYASNPRTLKQDYYGTPIEEIPIMKDVQSITDFELYVFGCITWIDPWMRQFSGKLPIILCIDAAGMPLIIPWIGSGQLYSALRGARGAAEYCALLGTVGPATMYMDAGSLTGIFALLLVIIGNIIFLRERARRKE